MVSFEQVAGLVLACTVLIALPGPSVLFIVGRALSYGRSAALASVAGNAVGCYLAAACVAAGLGPLLARSEVLFHLIKWVGALYLIWLGVQSLRHSRTPAAARPSAENATPAAHTQRPWRSVRTGILVGVTNPKSFIIFAAILPQFVDRQAAAIPGQMLVLALVPILIGMVFDSAWALAASRARHWLARSPQRMRAITRTGGLCTIGLGVSVAVTGQHQ